MKTANNLLPKFKKLLNGKLDRGIDGTNFIYKIISAITLCIILKENFENPFS